MARNGIKNRASYWSDSLINDLEFLTAKYVSQEFAPHTHDGYAIGVVEYGALSFQYHDPSDVVPTGNIMIIHPEEVHTGKCIGSHGCNYRMIYVKPQILRKAFSQLHKKNDRYPFFRNQNITDPVLAAKILQTHRAFESSALNDLEKESIILMLSTELVARHASPKSFAKPVKAEKVVVKKARRYLEDRRKENVSLKELASQVNISPFHLNRVFKAETGLPPYAYLTQIRIQEAMRLLRNGKSITDVALQTGFCDQSQFTKRFKQLVGTTPGLFIKK